MSTLPRENLYRASYPGLELRGGEFGSDQPPVMGGHFAVGIRQVDDLLAAIGGARLICTVVHGGEPLRQANLAGAWAFGAEGAGLSPQVLARAAARVTIPMAGGESLNVAAAAAICLYESFSRPGGGS